MTNSKNQTPLPDAAKIKSPTLRQLLLKSTLLSFLFAFVMLLITGIFVFLVVLAKFNSFNQAAQLNYQETFDIFQSGYRSSEELPDQITFLILGVDSVENKQFATPLTDTMILASINLKTANINLLSLPRDLWSEDFKTKINALYHYGQEKDANNPTQFVTQTISQLTNTSINHTIVISLDSLENIIDIIGGVEVDIPESFTDTNYPKDNVDVLTIKPGSSILYETITFEQGKEVMSGPRAIKYIRSRYSLSDEGTDLARNNRQQQVIMSLFNQISKPRQYWSQPKIAGSLFHFYLKEFDQYFSLESLIGTAIKLVPLRDKVTIKSHSLSLSQPNSPGALTHPPQYLYNNQWVFAIDNIEIFQQEIKNGLEI